MDLHLQVDRRHRKLTVRLVGDLDLATAALLTDALSAFNADAFACVTLDLAELRFCDCAGLNALMTAHRALTGAGSQFHIVRARQPVHRLFTVAGCQWLLQPGHRPDFPPTPQDPVIASVSRINGISRARLDPADTVASIHDVGAPPRGHQGERNGQTHQADNHEDEAYGGQIHAM